MISNVYIVLELMFSTACDCNRSVEQEQQKKTERNRGNESGNKILNVESFALPLPRANITIIVNFEYYRSRLLH